jgi:sulfatase maturation enzyme AslB (radical SAM superfamily)
MKNKNEVLVNSIGVLSKLNNEELPVKISYKLAKNIKEIDDTLKVFNDEKQKLINKYAEKDENEANKIAEDGTVNIVDSIGWNKDYKELIDIEVELKIDKINIDEFAKTDIKITPAELNLIDYLIK